MLSETRLVQQASAHRGWVKDGGEHLVERKVTPDETVIISMEGVSTESCTCAKPGIYASLLRC